MDFAGFVHPIANDLAGIIDVASAQQRPVPIVSHQPIEIKHLPIAIDEAVTGASGRGAVANNLVPVIQTVGNAVGAAERPQIRHLARRIKERVNGTEKTGRGRGFARDLARIVDAAGGTERATQRAKIRHTAVGIKKGVIIRIHSRIGLADDLA